ncbi:acyltransferase family protein [Fundicoccus culcitae]|uniref:Acyltransferase n=1 Tax=Fundicoccus culcitae TaxID=2969821 RepID=A0ABY5P4Y2_9LACT|nr:acyltransferase family protein [Fundicoccus culcitae]UUX33631.1 acyltransferase [Fundicoccus culcitae]
MTKRDERNSNFELLRIISMFLIVVHHFSVHGNFDTRDVFSYEKIALDILYIGGKLGVNIFVMIGAYFLVGKSFKWRRPVGVLIDMLVYNWGLFVVILLFRPNILTAERIYQMLVPFPNYYWFPTNYILLLMLTPVLNYFIRRVSELTLRYTLILLTVIWVFVPSLELTGIGYSDLSWFVYLYLLVAYIKLYPNVILNSPTFAKRLFWLSMTLTVVSILYFNAIGIVLPDKLAYGTFFLGSNKILTVGNSLGLWLWFKNRKPFSNHLINITAQAMFGVYLIHEQPLMRHIIWYHVDNSRVQGFWAMIAYGLIASAVVFVGCTLIDMLKNAILNPTLNKLSLWIEEKLNNSLGLYIEV